MRILPYTAFVIVVLFTVLMITIPEYIAIVVGIIPLEYLISIYLFPTLAEEWSIALAMFIAALVVGMVFPFFARNKWVYCHLLTLITFIGTLPLFEEVGISKNNFVLMITCVCAAGLFSGSALVPRHIKMTRRGGTIESLMAIYEGISTNVIRNILYLLIGSALLPFALHFYAMVDHSLHTPAENRRYLIEFFSQYIILILLVLPAYKLPNASGWKITSLYGVSIFLLITFPVLIKLYIEYDFYLHGLLIIFQWVIVAMIIIAFGIDALFSGIGSYLQNKKH